jgi:hypothetical protein
VLLVVNGYTFGQGALNSPSVVRVPCFGEEKGVC